VAKIAAGGTGLFYSTYLGNGGDEAEAIAVDGAGNAWVTGDTDSTNFPTTGNAVQKSNRGNPYAVFVAELTADGSALPYATYLGGSGDNGSYGLAVDSANNVYIVGETSATDFPTVNATQATYGGGTYNAFVSELTAAGGALAFSTYLGGSGDDAAFGIAVAPDDSVDVAGLTSSTNFPTVNPLQAANAGTYNAFVASYGAPASTCPSPWLCADIGNPPLTGDQTLTNGTWTIHGSGADIWNASDQFHFVWQGVSGDSSIVARLTSQQNTSICTKAGIMYRASTDPADVNYSVVMLPDCHFSTSSVQVNARSAVSTTTTTANDTLTALPVYLKATRTGSTFTAYTSSDGVTWTPIPNSAVSLPNMPNTALVGLAVCSQNSATTSQATFDNVSLAGSADLTQLDTDTAHYTQTVGLSSTSANLQLFNGPVGSLAGGAWTPRNTTLSPVTGTGMLAPAQVPFGLQIAQASGGPTLASLTTEDGITVGLGLASGAATPTPVTGRVNLNAVTYPSLTFPVVAPPTATATITATPPPTSTPVNSAGGVNVYVGYADSLRPNPNLPVPWQGAPNTGFVGHADSGGVYDSGAIRLDNTTAATVTIKDATIILHTVNNDGTGGPASGQTFDLWGSNTIAPNGSLILAATGPGDNFDTSDFPLAGTSCTSSAGPTTNPPHITLTFGDNSQATITDTAHVLDTGGYDTVTCPGGNESLQWRALGTTGVAQASGHLTLAAQTAPQIAGLPYAEIATLTDASNQPQPNVAVNFGVASGPNAGLTGQAFTDSQGHATFTYTSTVAGTDTITASLTNASGGVVTATPVTVTWSPPPVGDLSLQAIPAGLDVRVVLQNATSAGPFTLALAPDPSTNTQLVQGADGSIAAVQPITTYGDDRVAPVAITQTEYTVQPPSATDSNADPATLVNGGPVTPTLISTTGITQYVTLNVDPKWLNDPHRVFPVTLDLPIMTADAAANTDVFGTASSCAPNATIPQAVVVGAENGCTYNGQVSFDLSSLPAGASIVSATLNMYTPNQTGPTGVQVLQNAPPSSDSPVVTLASWNGAPAVVTPAAPIAQSGNAGHWQSWTITSLAQQWSQDGSTNGGLTLTGAGTPVRFAFPGGLANDSPTLAPYLTIGYGTASGGGAATMAAPSTAGVTTNAASAAPTYHDGQPFIYGEASTYDANAPNTPGSCPPNSTAVNKDITCGGNNIKVAAVSTTAHPGVQTNSSFGGQYIRFGVNVPCPNNQSNINAYKPGPTYWDTADRNNALGSTTARIIQAAYTNGLIPVVNVTADLCTGRPYDTAGVPSQLLPSQPSPAQWQQDMQDLASYVYSAALKGYPSRRIYFEIGNEEDLNNGNDGFQKDKNGNLLPPGPHSRLIYQGTASGKPFYYPEVFGAAAQGLNTLATLDKVNNFRVMIGGMFNPTSKPDPSTNKVKNGGCKEINWDNNDLGSDGHATDSNILIARDAIRDAVANGVASNNLALAVHTYGYDTKPGEGLWRNYYNEYPGAKTGIYRGWGGVCRDLGYMLATWTNSKFNRYHLPIFSTEGNWSTGPTSPNDCNNSYGCAGNYLVDLFSYLFDKYSTRNAKGKLVINPDTTPVRFLFYRGVDDFYVGDRIGLYDIHGVAKAYSVYATYSSHKTKNPINTCYNSQVIGFKNMPHDYYWLRNGTCYARQQGNGS